MNAKSYLFTFIRNLRLELEPAAAVHFLYPVKTLALSKLIFICSVMNTTKELNKEVNKITFDFIRNYKLATIKKATLIKQKIAGGLDMKDFSLFDKAINWVELGETIMLQLEYSMAAHT